MAANDQRKIATAVIAAGVVILSAVASLCRPARWGRSARVMSAYPELAGDFAL